MCGLENVLKRSLRFHFSSRGDSTVWNVHNENKKAGQCTCSAYRFLEPTMTTPDSTRAGPCCSPEHVPHSSHLVSSLHNIVSGDPVQCRYGAILGLVALIHSQLVWPWTVLFTISYLCFVSLLCASVFLCTPPWNFPHPAQHSVLGTQVHHCQQGLSRGPVVLSGCTCQRPLHA